MLIVEVKMTANWDVKRQKGVAKDLKTLAAFLTAPEGRAYEGAALILYGPGDPAELRELIHNEVNPDDLDALARAHILHHPRWGHPAQDLGPIYEGPA